MTEYATLALAEACTERSGPSVSFAAPALAREIEFVPDDTFAAPASLIQHIALTREDIYAAPALVIEHVSVAPVSQVNGDTRSSVNPHFSTAPVEVILQEIPELQVIERARGHIAFLGQIYQEQIVVLSPQFKKQFVKASRRPSGTCS